MKTIVKWALVASLVLFIIRSPAAAAAATKRAGSGLGGAAEAVGIFLTSLIS